MVWLCDDKQGLMGSTWYFITLGIEPYFPQSSAAAIQAFGVEWVFQPHQKRHKQDHLAETLSTVLVLKQVSGQIRLRQNGHNSQEQSSDSHSSKPGNTSDSVSRCQRVSGNLKLSTLVHTSKQRALLIDMNADENMALLNMLTEELAEEEMDPNT